MPENIVLFVHHRAFAPKKQQRILVVQHPYLIRGQQLPPGLLIVGGIAPTAPFCLAVGAGFDGFLAQQFRHIFVRLLLVPAQIQETVAVAHHALPLLFKQTFQLRQILQNN